MELGRDLARVLHVRFSDDLAAELAAIRRRGCEVSLVFAATDPGIALLRDHGGAAVRHMESKGELKRCLISDANHTFTALTARETLIAELESLLQRNRSTERCRGES